jgi:hypothetical protein
MAYEVIMYKHLVYKLSVTVIDELYLPAALLLTTEPTASVRQTRGRQFITRGKGKICYRESNQSFLPISFPFTKLLCLY